MNLICNLTTEMGTIPMSNILKELTTTLILTIKLMTIPIMIKDLIITYNKFLKETPLLFLNYPKILSAEAILISLEIQKTKLNKMNSINTFKI